ncbi:tetratricopeptide repeat protein [Streptomyces sp. BE133]|uniref:tetratricopeptide repeat protein n=1 Tax=Streptomyces sp. BE133 TaxID=3002523 RepID=UPI002E7A5A5A|nr:tetratricopeptide repeat protein [Streptomyces sp. BE133]MEE1805557.1 tetratricopeptide repeat protein [Streptomyces sp. BE133]
MADERKALVIASHWDVREEKPGSRLDLLEPCATELTTLLLDPLRGGCVPAWGDGLLTDPTVDEVTAALTESFAGASASGDSLVVGFVGHGHAGREDEFLFPVCSTPAVPGPETALQLPQVLRALAQRHGGVRELTVIVDACMSGYAVLAGASTWFRSAMQTGRRVEILSSADGRLAYGLQFTVALNGLIRQGDIRLGGKLYTGPVRRLVDPQLVKQDPQSASYDGGGSASGDPYGTWIAHNVAHNASLSVLAGTRAAKELVPALQYFQAPDELARFIASVRRHRVVVVVGAMGTGKTTVAAALCRTELLPEQGAPAICAVIRLSDAAWTSGLSMTQLAGQLRLYLPGFPEAEKAYRARASADDQGSLRTAEFGVAGPLGLMESREPVRVIVDGLDQVHPTNRVGVMRELATLSDAAPSWFGLVVTSRDGVRLPDDWHRESVLAAAGERQLSAYLTAHSHSAESRREILRQAAGNWEITRLLADFGPLAHTGSVSYEELYAGVLLPARDAAPDGRGEWVDAVLAVLAASGLGAELPRALLARAAGELGGPAGEDALGQVLDLLPGLIVRAHHPDGTELLGVHHQTLVEYLSGMLDVVSGHRALCRALETMAPMDQHMPDDPLHAYAEQAEPEHLWQAALRDPSQYERLLAALEQRAAAEPTVNRDRWAAWAQRLAERLGADTPIPLRARERAAYWTGKAGSYRRSRELHQELLEDQRRVLAKDAPEVLETRHRIAYATGETGDFHTAMELHRAVLADQIRVLGPDDRRTLATRHHIAYWTGRGRDMMEGLRLHEELLEDQRRVLGPMDQDVLESRHYIAYWHGVLGRPLQALALHDELLHDRLAVFGEDHAQVVFSRMNICRFLGEAGRRQEALSGYRALLPDVERIRGEDHPNTLVVRLNIARYTWELGDPEGSLRLHEALIEDQRRVNGANHPTVMISRYNMAMLKAELGDPVTALAELDALHADRLARYQNPLHAEVITTLYGRALVTAQLGDVAAAIEAMRAVREDRARALGEDHPSTLAAASALDDLLAR